MRRRQMSKRLSEGLSLKEDERTLESEKMMEFKRVVKPINSIIEYVHENHLRVVNLDNGDLLKEQNLETLEWTVSAGKKIAPAHLKRLRAEHDYTRGEDEYAFRHEKPHRGRYKQRRLKQPD